MQKRWMARWAGSRDWRKRRENHQIPSKPLRNPFETPSKPLRNITLTPRQQHACNTLAAGWALAERAEAGRWGLRRWRGCNACPANTMPNRSSPESERKPSYLRVNAVGAKRSRAVAPHRTATHVVEGLRKFLTTPDGDTIGPQGKPGWW